MNKIESHRFIQIFNSIFLLLNIFPVLIFSYIWLLVGKLTNINVYNVTRGMSPFIDAYLIFCYLSLFGITSLVLFGALQHLANKVIAESYLLIDENGITRSGRGIRRDLFVSWDNIKQIKGYGPSKAVFRIWLKNPHKAWRGKNWLLAILTWLKAVFSFGLLTTPVEWPYFQIQAHELNMRGNDIEKIFQQSSAKAEATDWHPRIGWGKDTSAKLPKFVNAIYLIPLISLMIGMIFFPVSPKFSNMRPDIEPSYEFEVKMLIVIGTVLFCLSAMVGLWRVFKRIFFKKRTQRKKAYVNLSIFFLSIIVLYYATYLNRPYSNIGPDIEAKYGFEAKLLMLVGTIAFCVSTILGLWRIFKRIFLKKRIKRKTVYVNLLIFFLSFIVAFYGAYLYRPYSAAKLGFSTYGELREARTHGITTGEEWQEYLKNKKSQ